MNKRSNPPFPSCGSCGSLLVHMTEGHETKSAVWEIEVRCPECERREVAYITQAELELFDSELNRAASEIEQELGRLEALHMEEWAARFSQALDLDLIAADDF